MNLQSTDRWPLTWGTEGVIKQQCKNLGGGAKSSGVWAVAAGGSSGAFFFFLASCCWEMTCFFCIVFKTGLSENTSKEPSFLTSALLLFLFLSSRKGSLFFLKGKRARYEFAKIVRKKLQVHTHISGCRCKLCLISFFPPTSFSFLFFSFSSFLHLPQPIHEKCSRIHSGDIWCHNFSVLNYLGTPPFPLTCAARRVAWFAFRSVGWLL